MILDVLKKVKTFCILFCAQKLYMFSVFLGGDQTFLVKAGTI